MQNAASSHKDAPAVVMLAGGGLGPGSGGVGTLIGYLLAQWGAVPGAPPVRVLDSWGQGGARGVWHFTCAAGTLCLLLARGRACVVHAHMTTRGSVARKIMLVLCAMAANVPVVMHMHGADFFEFFQALPSPARRLLASILRRCARVIVLGDAWRDFLLREAGLPPGIVTIVRNAVPRPARGACPPPGPPRILFLGRLGPRKGTPDLIASLARDAVRARDWQAVIAGDGPVSETRRLVDEQGLAGRIRVPGWVGREAANALLSEASILVLPSHHEAMPIAVLEALAAGVCVLTTRAGLIPELLQDGVNARLVDAGDEAALAIALCALIDNEALRRRLAEAGHAVFLRHLDIRRAANELLDIYEYVRKERRSFLQKRTKKLLSFWAWRR